MSYTKLTSIVQCSREHDDILQTCSLHSNKSTSTKDSDLLINRNSTSLSLILTIYETAIIIINKFETANRSINDYITPSETGTVEIEVIIVQLDKVSLDAPSGQRTDSTHIAMKSLCRAARKSPSDSPFLNSSHLKTKPRRVKILTHTCKPLQTPFLRSVSWEIVVASFGWRTWNVDRFFFYRNAMQRKVAQVKTVQ